MGYKDLKDLIALYEATFASLVHFYEIEEHAKKRGMLTVMTTMRKAKAISNLLGWENASFALFEAILYGDLQIEIDEEGEANAEPSD